jgi:sigma-B regulation protein RsbU (phosphoserine phosphatase)
MVRLFSPGIRLLNRLRYPQKFLLVSMLLVLPLILANGLLLSETMPRIEFLRLELAGSDYVERLRSLIGLLEKSHQNIEASQSPQMQARQADITNNLAALQADPELDALFATHAPLQEIQRLHQLLEQDILSNDEEAIDKTYIVIMSALREEIRRIGDASNLILDPELTTYYLMDTAVVQAPARSLLLLKVHQTIDEAATNPQFRYELAALAGQIEDNVDTTRKGVQVALASDPQLNSTLTAALADSLTSATTLTEALRATGTSNVEQIIVLSTDAFQANMQLWQSSLTALDIRLHLRMNMLVQKNMLATGVAIALLICAAYLLIAFYRSMMQTVGVLDLASRQMLAGSHGMEVQIAARDELGQVVASFNRVASALVAESNERQVAEVRRTELQEQIIQTQAANLDALSVPIIPLGNHVLLLPLIGAIDTTRAQQILETLLHGVASHKAELLILDMTGVRFVDAQVAQAILNAVQGARLLGANVVLAGVRAEVATTMVNLAVDLRSLAFYATLQEALAATTLA